MLSLRSHLGAMRALLVLLLPVVTTGSGGAADRSADTARSRSGATQSFQEPAGAARLGGAAGASASQARANRPGKTASSGKDPAQLPRPSSTSPEITGPGGSAMARSGSSFEFRICNRSDQPAMVATTFGVGARWLIQGWFRVGSGECRGIGRIQHGWLYYYAETESGDGSWGGGAIDKCVQYPGPWQRFETDEPYTCGDDEALKSFGGQFIDANTGTFTWNLNP